MGSDFDMAFVAAVFCLLVIALVAANLQGENYTITNLTKDKTERTYMEIANDSWSQMRGLMFRDKVIPILFPFGYTGKFPIHSYFCKEFDAVYLSENGTVVEIFRNIPPNVPRISPQKDASYLLELPVDDTDALNIEVGDQLAWSKL